MSSPKFEHSHLMKQILYTHLKDPQQKNHAGKKSRRQTSPWGICYFFILI